jgi:hypothetical protein
MDTQIQRREQKIESIYDGLLNRLAANVADLPIDEFKVLYQLHTAEKELAVSERRIAQAEKKQSGAKESFGPEQYNEAIDRLMGAEQP